MNNTEHDEALMIVHITEMTTELATTLSDETTRISNTHHLRRPAGDIANVASYHVVTTRCPRDQIPNGQAVHIEQRGRELIQIYDETHITPELAAHLAVITQESGRYYDLKL